MTARRVILALALVALTLGAAQPRTRVVVGSKPFTEGYVLAEIFSQLLNARGFEVERSFGLGGTLVCYRALTAGEIDVYPEYTGTIAEAILEMDEAPSTSALDRALREKHGLDLLSPLGFDNTYALAVTRSLAERLRLRTVGDLSAHPTLRAAFSHEFMNRKDGWPGLARAYGLPQNPAGIEHGLAYEAVAQGKIDVTDVYSTDGDIEKYDLVLLDDDRGYFPVYLAAPLVRDGLDARVKAVLDELGGTIDAATMRDLNAGVLIDRKSFARVAAEFLEERGLTGPQASARADRGRWRALLSRTATHLELTLVALLAAVLVAVPAGVCIYRFRRISRPVLYATGVLQTIPSIALLALMIPLFGIGVKPAIAALFLYSLLPIVRNTAAALFSIDPVLEKVAVGMGLTRMQRLRHVELPLASPTILAGVKTAAVINIGTATLAAFIGAGGLGEPIVTGLALNDTSLILEGAVPAALLAVATELAFEAIERFVVPKHLRAATRAAVA